jgi:hypothetical protein
MSLTSLSLPEIQLLKYLDLTLFALLYGRRPSLPNNPEWRWNREQFRRDAVIRAFIRHRWFSYVMIFSNSASVGDLLCAFACGRLGLTWDGKISRDEHETETKVWFTFGGMCLVLRPANADRTRGDL